MRNLPLQIAEEFTEVAIGEWTDRAFADLQVEALWTQFNSFAAPPPRLRAS